MIELQCVTKKYENHTALDGLSLRIEPGVNLALIGPSGCGKSTALKLLAGLDLPSNGHIFLDGKLASDKNSLQIAPHERGISMVFQDLGLWPNLSVINNIELGIFRYKPAEKRSRTMDALKICGIVELATRLPAEISGGQLQRVALARALATRPRFLFLDEPFSGLDLVNKARLFQQLIQLGQERKITLLLVTHDPWEAAILCQKVIVLDNGRIAEAGMLHEILRNPKTELMKLFAESGISSEGKFRKS